MSSNDLRCERNRLLLSLRADGATTPDQAAELEAHLTTCAACRAAAAVDRAVGERLRERAEGEVPSGFSAGVLARVVAERARAAAENRFLRRAAVAAALVCAVAGGSIAFRGPANGGGADGERSVAASARDAARASVLRPRLEGR
jgi:anti-sigma factor RsiW